MPPALAAGGPARVDQIAKHLPARRRCRATSCWSSWTARPGDVTVVDLAPPPDRLLGAVVGSHIHSVAADAGVRIVVTNGGVRLLGAPTPTGVELVDGTRLEADPVVLAVGDVPNVEWLAGSGVQLAGGVVADHHCRVAPDVVAAGDVTLIADVGANLPTSGACPW